MVETLAKSLHELCVFGRWCGVTHCIGVTGIVTEPLVQGMAETSATVPIPPETWLREGGRETFPSFSRIVASCDRVIHTKERVGEQAKAILAGRL